MEKSRWIVEIGDHKVRAACYQASDGDGQILRLASADIPSGDDGLIQCLRQIFGSPPNNIKNAALLIPRHQASVQILRFPSSDESEIFNMARIRLLKHFPYEEKEAVMTHRVLGIMDGYATVQMIWAVKASILSKCEALNACGIDVEKVVFGGEALERWLSDTQPEVRGQKILMIHLSEDRLEIQIINHSILVFSRGLKRARSSEWWKEVESSVAGYDEELLGKLESIYFFGEDADAERMRSLAADMAIPFIRLSLRQGLSAPLAGQLDQDSSYFTLLSACRVMPQLKVDLTPPDVVEHSKKRAFKQELRWALIWATAIVLLGLISTFLAENSRKSAIRRLDAEIASVKPKAESVEKMRRLLRAAKEAAQSKPRAADIFLEIHQLTPSGIVLESLDYDDRHRMTLHGSATDLGMVSGFAGKLEQSAIFSQAKVLYTKNQERADSPGVDFEIVSNVDQAAKSGVSA